jgi:hypothetical protein
MPLEFHASNSEISTPKPRSAGQSRVKETPLCESRLKIVTLAVSPVSPSYISLTYQTNTYVIGHGALSCKMGLKKRATDRFDRPVGPPPERRRVRSHEKSAMKRWLSTVQKGSLDLTSRQMYESDGGSPEEYTCATP